MKFERKEIIGGNTVITTSKRFLFWRIITKYQFTFYAGGNWVTYPHGILVDVTVQAQLSVWDKMHKPVNG